MDDRTLQVLKGRLEERRAEIESSVSFMSNEMRSIGIDQDDENGSIGNHIADDGSNVTEAERIVTVTEDLQYILAQVNSALGRMEEGSYGICMSCGRPINEERLDAFPYVAYCIDCQSRIEREQALRGGS